MADLLRAYLQFWKYHDCWGRRERESFCDHAIELFHGCSSTSYLGNCKIEALATAAVVQAFHEAQVPHFFTGHTREKSTYFSCLPCILQFVVDQALTLSTTMH
jgi:hypothetical protein